MLDYTAMEPNEINNEVKTNESKTLKKYRNLAYQTILESKRLEQESNSARIKLLESTLLNIISTIDKDKQSISYLDNRNELNHIETNENDLFLEKEIFPFQENNLNLETEINYQIQNIENDFDFKLADFIDRTDKIGNGPIFGECIERGKLLDYHDLSWDKEYDSKELKKDKSYIEKLYEKDNKYLNNLNFNTTINEKSNSNKFSKSKLQGNKRNNSNVSSELTSYKINKKQYSKLSLGDYKALERPDYLIQNYEPNHKTDLSLSYMYSKLSNVSKLFKTNANKTADDLFANECTARLDRASIEERSMFDFLQPLINRTSYSKDLEKAKNESVKRSLSSPSIINVSKFTNPTLFNKYTKKEDYSFINKPYLRNNSRPSSPTLKNNKVTSKMFFKKYLADSIFLSKSHSMDSDIYSDSVTSILQNYDSHNDNKKKASSALENLQILLGCLKVNENSDKTFKEVDSTFEQSTKSVLNDIRYIETQGTPVLETKLQDSKYSKKVGVYTPPTIIFDFDMNKNSRGVYSYSYKGSPSDSCDFPESVRSKSISDRNELLLEEEDILNYTKTFNPTSTVDTISSIGKGRITKIDSTYDYSEETNRVSLKERINSTGDSNIITDGFLKTYNALENSLQNDSRTCFDFYDSDNNKDNVNQINEQYTLKDRPTCQSGSKSPNFLTVENITTNNHCDDVLEILHTDSVNISSDTESHEISTKNNIYKTINTEDDISTYFVQSGIIHTPEKKISNIITQKEQSSNSSWNYPSCKEGYSTDSKTSIDDLKESLEKNNSDINIVFDDKIDCGLLNIKTFPDKTDIPYFDSSSIKNQICSIEILDDNNNLLSEYDDLKSIAKICEEPSVLKKSDKKSLTETTKASKLLKSQLKKNKILDISKKKKYISTLNSYSNNSSIDIINENVSLLSETNYFKSDTLKKDILNHQLKNDFSTKKRGNLIHLTKKNLLNKLSNNICTTEKKYKKKSSNWSKLHTSIYSLSNEDSDTDSETTSSHIRIGDNDNCINNQSFHFVGDCYTPTNLREFQSSRIKNDIYFAQSQSDLGESHNSSSTSHSTPLQFASESSTKWSGLKSFFEKSNKKHIVEEKVVTAETVEDLIMLECEKYGLELMDIKGLEKAANNLTDHRKGYSLAGLNLIRALSSGNEFRATTSLIALIENLVPYFELHLLTALKAIQEPSKQLLNIPGKEIEPLKRVLASLSEYNATTRETRSDYTTKEKSISIDYLKDQTRDLRGSTPNIMRASQALTTQNPISIQMSTSPAVTRTAHLREALRLSTVPRNSSVLISQLHELGREVNALDARNSTFNLPGLQSNNLPRHSTYNTDQNKANIYSPPKINEIQSPGFKAKSPKSPGDIIDSLTEHKQTASILKRPETPERRVSFGNDTVKEFEKVSPSHSPLEESDDSENNIYRYSNTINNNPSKSVNKSFDQATASDSRDASEPYENNSSGSGTNQSQQLPKSSSGLPPAQSTASGKPGRSRKNPLLDLFQD